MWEHTAGVFKEKYPPSENRLLFARVDCTREAARPVCAANHIQAFPSIRIFRKGVNVHEVPASACTCMHAH